MQNIKNKDNKSYILPTTIVLSFFSFGLLVYAVDPSSLSINIKLDNPIGSNTLQDFIIKVIHVVKLISIPIITFFIIYSGFLFVTAPGDKTKLEGGKKSLYGAVIGTAIILGATILANAIQGTISKF